MEAIIERSSLCKDIYQLEKDFRHNLFLLKVKETEIERYKKHNDKLLHDLKNHQQQHINNAKQIADLEKQLVASNFAANNVRNHYETIVAQLTNELHATKESHENYKRNQMIEVKKRETELERVCAMLTESKTEEHKRKMSDINNRFQMELCLTDKLKTRLEQIVNENLSLRTKFQENQSDYIAKIAALKSELKSVRNENIRLANILETKRKDCVHFEMEMKRMEQENEAMTNDGKTDIIRQLNAISEERNDLRKQLETQNTELNNSLEIRTKIESELNQLRLEYKLDGSTICTKPEHDNVDFVLKQNAVLQEVIKSLRNERTQTLNNPEMERKIERLEELVKQLKMAMLNNLGIKEIITQQQQEEMEDNCYQ